MILSVNNYSHRVANSDSDKKGQNQIQESSRICAFFPQAIPGGGVPPGLGARLEGEDRRPQTCERYRERQMPTSRCSVGMLGWHLTLPNEFKSQ